MVEPGCATIVSGMIARSGLVRPVAEVGNMVVLVALTDATEMIEPPATIVPLVMA